MGHIRLAAIVVTLSIVACTSTSTPDELVVTPGTPAAQRDPAGPAVASTPTAGCEDFGTLSGTSLAATVDDSGATPFEMTLFALSGRPVATKVRVLASGDPTALVGRTAVLGADMNVSYSTCTHCLLVAIGCAADCSNAAMFFPRSGSATFTSLAPQPGQTFSGTFKDVELEQVTIDPATLLTRPVPGGACIRIPTLTFAAQTAAAAPADGGTGGAGDSGTNNPVLDAGSGSDGGSQSGGGGGGGGKTKAIFF